MACFGRFGRFGRFGPFWALFGASAELCPHPVLGLFRAIWAVLGRFGPFLVPRPSSVHTLF